jgi:1-acyl-sn-glycerol-3-phosphate acyltransferase
MMTWTDAVRRAPARERWLGPAARIAASGAMVTIAAMVMLPIGAVTLFRARRVYSRMARYASLAVLRLHGIRIRVHGPAFPNHQAVYVSNHTSTLDVFVLVALGLPNCRFFLSGFLRKLVPLGIISWMMGTFFTVPQDRPDERTRIFRNAERTLRRTRESVYLSPEGGRIRTGEVGPFNKGAFHLATNLHVPIVPFYIRIPDVADPGMGYAAGSGLVDVFVLPPIDTTDWVLTDLLKNKDQVRDLFVRVHGELQCA